MNADELLIAINSAGLDEHAQVIADLARPCVIAQATRIAGAAPTTLGSRFGGLPMLPRGQFWPRGRKSPLVFLGQVVLSSVASRARLPELPESGVLSFWYEFQDQPWGFDPKDRGGAKVIFIPDEATSLATLQVPNGHADSGRDRLGLDLFPPCTLRFEEGWSVPDTAWIRAYAPAAEFLCHLDGYDELLELASGCPRHQILGHPNVVQNPMEEECQLVTNGLYCGDASGYRDPRAATLKQHSLDWQLLLQIDTDEDGPGWMWGDCGRLYFWIRKQDLAARNFANTWTILQCF